MSDHASERRGARPGGSSLQEEPVARVAGRGTLVEAEAEAEAEETAEIGSGLALTTQNSAAPRDAQTRRPPAVDEVVSTLTSRGYRAVAIAAANVLNEQPNAPGALPANGASPYAAGVHNASGIRAAHGYDAVINGAFYNNIERGDDGATNPAFGLPLGSVMRDGRLDNVGMSDKTANRGAFAILDDGTMILGQALGMSQAELVARFSQPGRGLSDVVAGGILLVEHGRVASDQLLVEQHVDPTKLARGQNPLQASQHTLLAIKDGALYAIANLDQRTANSIVADLLAVGMQTVLKLDGGSGFHYVDESRTQDSNNPVSIGIKHW